MTTPTRGFIRIFLLDKSNFGALEKKHILVIISALSFNMSWRGLTCNPGKVFMIMEIMTDVVLSPEGDFKKSSTK